MYELDQDTRLEPRGEGRYAGHLSERYNIGPVPNGGFVMCFMCAAVQQELADLEPLTTTAHFLKPSTPGPAEVIVDVLKRGRRYSTAQASLVQDGTVRVQLLTTLGQLPAAAEPRYMAGAPPALDEAALLADRPSDGLPEIAKRFDVRAEPEGMGWLAGEPSSQAVIRARMAFSDRRPIDPRALLLIADALPPPAFNRITPGWLPTLELTVHVRARPRSEWLVCQFSTRFISGGLLEEDGEIWDDGVLVAQSRQLAMVPEGA